MKSFRPDIKVDVTDLIVPISLLMVRKKLTEMNHGQIAEVLCGDSETKAVLIDILRNSKDRCLGVEKKNNRYKLFIEIGAVVK
jgi:TusA-related sulfurtransferase